jgi:prepilin-type N-terminal cleavage/methylation domain-containing protein
MLKSITGGGFMRSFTLIELLIVVAIIGILATVAVPNFMQAQTKAKVARVKADLRAITTAAGMYAVDRGQYPPHLLQESCSEIPYHIRYSFFTTPVAYISGFPVHEIFAPSYLPNLESQTDIFADTLYYTYTNFNSFSCRTPPPAVWYFRQEHAFLLRSRGPDGVLEPNAVRNAHFEGKGTLTPDPFLYSATNGLISRGDLISTLKENP